MLFDISAISTLMHAIFTALFGFTLLRAPDKTLASRVLGACFSFSSLMMFARFASHVFPFHELQIYAILVADLLFFTVNPLLLLWFAYVFPQPYAVTKRLEKLLVGGLVALIAVVGVGRFVLGLWGLHTHQFARYDFHMTLFGQFLLLHLLGFALILWVIVVLGRQTVYWSSQRAEASWWQHLRSPTNRKARTARAMLVIMVLCLGLAFVATLLQITLLKSVARPMAAVLFTLLFFSVGMAYLSYSPESSSFLSKIVLSSIGSLLVLVSLVGYLYSPRLALLYQSPRPPQAKKSWRFEPAAGGYRGQPVVHALEKPLGAPLQVRYNKSAPVDLGFGFPYFGKRWKRMYVNSRGLVTFGAPLAPLLYHQVISKAHIQPMIAPLAMDLSFDAESGIFVHKGPKKLRITWSKMLQPGTQKRQTFQLWLSSTGAFGFSHRRIDSHLVKLIGFQSGQPGATPRVASLASLSPKLLLTGGLHDNHGLLFRKQMHEWSYGLVILMVILCVAVFVGFWFLFLYGIAKPLDSLIGGVRRVNAGELEVSLPIYFNDEIGFLTRSFNGMVESIKKADQLKDEFLANTSHELRTPLNGIIGIAESLYDGVAGELPPVARTNLAMVVQSGRRLTHLVNDILDFSRLKHDELELRQVPLDLHVMVDVVLTLSAPLLEGKEIELRNEVPKTLPLVLADEDRIQQVLHNLVGNAIKFTLEGEVEVSARVEGEEVALSVRDTGIGIDEQQQEKIFEAFAQGDGSTARHFGGTGLGLTVTHHLVMLHQGTLTVDSRLGEGSTFTLTLPLAPEGSTAAEPRHAEQLSRLLDASKQELREVLAVAPDAPRSGDTPDRAFPAATRQEPSYGTLPAMLTTAESQLASDSNRSFHVLIVDDEPINLQVLENYLSMQDYQAHRAPSGAKALEMLEAGLQPDLILLDVMMPNMSGYELCKQLRQRFPASELPVVLVTAKNQVADLVEGFGVGANDYLTKPVSKQELLARVQTHLRLSRINQAASRFVPFEFLSMLGKESLIEVQLGDQIQREMTVLFSDIRSFTTLSEKMTPEQNFAFINEYLRHMEPVVHRHGGFIDKYIGDAVMALFDKSAHSGVDAAVGMVKALEDFNRERLAKAEVAIGIGVGLNTGLLMLGTIGGSERMDGTVISDAVNLAARVEGMTKHYGASVLISEFTRKALDDPDKYHMRLVDKVQVKGKDEPVEVYEVFDGDPAELFDKKSATLEQYNEAMRLYMGGQFVEAKATFAAVLSRFPQDKTASLYIERCQEMEQRGAPEGWDGVTRLTSK